MAAWIERVDEAAQHATRVLFIASDNTHVALSALHHLVGGCRAGAVSIRIFDWERAPLSLADLRAELECPGELLQLLIVDALRRLSPEDRDTLRDLAAGSSSELIRLSNAAIGGNSRLIILARPSLISASSKLAANRWTLDPLGPHLGHRFHDRSPADIARLADVLAERARCGDLDEVIASIDHQTFEQLLAFKEPALTTPLPTVPADPLHVAVLWLATYMPELPVGDFRRVLALLVEGQHVSSPLGSPDTARLQVPLIDLWPEASPRVLDDLGLGFVKRRDGVAPLGAAVRDSAVVRVLFVRSTSTPSKRLFEERLLEHHFNFVERVKRHGLPFDSSPEVASNAVQALVECAELCATSLSETWFLEVIIGAGPASVVSATGEDPISDRVVKALNALQDAARSHLYRGLGEILLQMHARVALRGLVDRVFRALVAIPDLRHAAIKILIFMRHSDFDVMSWFKRLADEGGGQVVDDLRDAITLCVAQDDTLARLTAAEQWLPAGTIGSFAAQQSAAGRGVELIVRVVERSMSPRSGSALGADPPQNFLLRWFAMHEATTERVLRWFFRSDVEHYLGERIPEHFHAFIDVWLVPPFLGDSVREAIAMRWWQFLVQTTVAEAGSERPVGRQMFHSMAFAHWAIALGGLGPTPAPPYTAIMPSLLAALGRVADRVAIHRMLTWWAQMERGLEDVLAENEQLRITAPPSLQPAHRDAKEKLLAVRRTIRDLRRRASPLLAPRPSRPRKTEP